VTDTDDTGDIQAGALFTSDLSSDYLSLLPDLHHMFVGLTQTKADRIVTMASAEIHPVDLAAATQQAEPTVFTATDESHPPTKAGNNDVAVPSHTTSDKDDAADKKRKAVEAVSSTPDAQRHKTTDAAPDAPHCATKAANNDVAGDNNDAAQLKPPPASDKIEDWLDDEAAVEQGFIRTGRKTYRPPLPNLYTGPALDDDLLDGHDWLYKEHGKALRHTKDPLPPRDNIIQFSDKPGYAQELEKNLRLDQCPPENQAAVRDLCTEFWDCFTQDGLSLPIRGFEFVVDTGTAAPIACKIPRYGPHESQVIMTLVHAMAANDIVEKCISAWAALVVLAPKANQEAIPWHEYIWRLCVSYRRLNQVTCPYAYPMPRCDDAVDEIPPGMMFFVSFDLATGYWQIIASTATQHKLAFYTPEGLYTFKRMPMGALNAAPVFVSASNTMKLEWNKDAAKKGLNVDKAGAKVIVDDILAYGTTIPILLTYLRCILTTLQHYSATVKLKKCKWFHSRLCFVGVDVCGDGNLPTKDKHAAFWAISQPHTFADLRMLIGMFGFYSRWLPNYEIRIEHWRWILKQQPAPGSATPAEERELVAALWEPQDLNLLDQLKEEVINGLVLARPDYNRRFYLKTDWSKHGMAAVLCQADPNCPESVAAEQAEGAGSPCLFDRAKTGPRLIPILFMARLCTAREADYHSYKGEAATGRWAINKNRKFLSWKEFTWISDCSGLRQFFESDEHRDRYINRWRAELLQYHFTIYHRNARWIVECDFLSRYNMSWDKRREEHNTDQRAQAATMATDAAVATAQVSTVWLTTPETDAGLPFSNTPIHLVGPHNHQNVSEWSPLATLWEQHRQILAIDSIGCPLAEALNLTQLTSFHITELETDSTATSISTLLQHEWPTQALDVFMTNLPILSPKDQPQFHWLVAMYPKTSPASGSKDSQLMDWYRRILQTAATIREPCNLQAVILIGPLRIPDTARALRAESLLWEAWPDWKRTTSTLCNTSHGGAMETKHQVLCLTRPGVTEQWEQPQATVETATGMEHIIGHHRQRAMIPQMLQLSSTTNAALSSTAGDKFSSRVIKRVRLRHKAGPTNGFPVYDPSGPAPSIADVKPTQEDFFDGPFGIWLPHDDQQSDTCRPILPHEIPLLLGLSDTKTHQLLQAPWPTALHRLRAVPGHEGLAALFDSLSGAEQQATMKEVQPYAGPTMISAMQAAVVLNQATTIPLPTDEDWRQAVAADHDLSRIAQALQDGPLNSLTKAELVEKAYFEEWKQERLVVDDGIVYRYEVRNRASIRQLRTRVVPPPLRRTIIVACHASPMAGHSGVTRTMYRVITRFWWPYVARDITNGVLGCATCRLANHNSHEAQMHLHAFTCDEPFSMIFLDMWKPGDVPEKDGTREVLTMMDGMTGFAAGAFLGKPITAEVLADVTFSQFFCVFGLPRIIVVDADSKFCGIFTKTFENLGIHVEVVSRENHKAVRNERFHRYLNRVQQINTAETGSFFQWKQGVTFALYGWNAGPIDGTNIPRSVGAIGRDFPFPLDTQTRPTFVNGFEGANAADHHDAIHPLIANQRELLRILNEERRQRHRDLKNDSITERTFTAGDLVIVRKQVKSNADRGIAGKIVFKSRGPYRVLEQANPGSYWIQKLPFLDGLGSTGRRVKESAARMERIPSTLVVHKRPDGADTRMASMRHPLVNNPVQKWLGAIDSGAYQPAAPTDNHAFVKIEDMWSDPMDESEDEEEEAAPTRTSAEEPPVTRTEPKTRRHVLLQLYRAIYQSRDKLCFFAHQPDGQTAETWYLVQVNLDKTDPLAAKELGRYWVHWMIRHHVDCLSKQTRLCRFWPEVHERTTNPLQPYGRIVPVRPGHQKSVLKRPDRILYEDEVDLASGLLHGPINYERDSSTLSELAWNAMFLKATLRGIDTNNANSVEPL
jgi:hypothetical protein